ncbi:hypothetical protein D3C81_1740510 [compost metagenome]
MLRARVGTVAVAIKRVRPCLAQFGVSHLGFTPRVVRLPQVGLKDGARPPGAAAVILPAVLANDLVEVRPELLQGAPSGNGFLYRTSHIGQQVAPGRSGHDESPVVLCGINIAPGAGREISFTLEVVDLLLKR